MSGYGAGAYGAGAYGGAVVVVVIPSNEPPLDEGYFRHTVFIAAGSSDAIVEAVTSIIEAIGGESAVEVILEPEDDVSGPDEALSDAVVDFVASEADEP